MRDEFEKMAAAGKLDRHHIDALVQLTTSRYCFHRSWGFGTIKAVDTVFARFTIDFEAKTGHAMDLTFAAQSLKPISPDHIMARKAANIEELRQLAATNHLEAPAEARLLALVTVGWADESPAPEKRPLADVLRWERIGA